MTNIIEGCSILLNIKTIVVKSIPLYHYWPSEQPSLPRPRPRSRPRAKPWSRPTLSKEELHQAGLRPRRTLFTFPRSKPCLHLTLNSKIISNDIYLGLQTLVQNVWKTSRLSQHCFDPQFHGRPLGNRDQSQRPGSHNIPLKFGCWVLGLFLKVKVYLYVDLSAEASLHCLAWNKYHLENQSYACSQNGVSMFLRKATKKMVKFSA